MSRRALIIYCDNTPSKPLVGPIADRNNFFRFLTSPLGGSWDEGEIVPLRNPTITRVKNAIRRLNGADYTFIIFTGHGEVRQKSINNIQYLELSDGDISVLELRSTAPKQTIIVDACRGYAKDTDIEFAKAMEHLEESGFAGRESTREIFDSWLNQCENGLVVLYAASEDETALDTPNGAAYLLSLLICAEAWAETDKKYSVLPLNIVHEWAVAFVSENFETIQVPEIKGQKRRNFFPFAVKNIPIYS